jgi:hypothetical protein
MYPLEIRIYVLNLYSKLKSLRQVFEIPFSTISRWVKNPNRKIYTRKQEACTLKSSVIIEIIKATIASNPLTSIRKLKVEIKNILDISISRELIRIVLKRLNLSRKKARFFSEPQNLAEKTRVFLEQRTIHASQGKHFVSIDETSFGRNSFETRGYSPRGKPLHIKKLRPRMTNVSALACASQYLGWLKVSQQARAYTSSTFLDVLETIPFPPDCVVLLDNVKFHHSLIVKEFFASKGIDVLYTPPYSPWFNPIEMCFSIVKKAFPECQDIEKSFKKLTPQHFESFFTKSLTCTEKF